MRNRILALFCVVAVLFGLLSSGTVTAVNAPAKIFELDLSAYKDVAYETSADGYEVSIKPGLKADGSAGGTIKKESFVNKAGETVEYIKMTETSNVTGGIERANRVTVSGTGISKNITTEFWVKYTAMGWRHFLGVMPFDSSGNAIDAQGIDLKTNTSTQLLFKGAGDSSTKGCVANNDKWQHIVFTKEYNADHTSAVSRYYCNGVLVHTATKSVSDYKDETSGTVYVGGPGFNSSWTSGNTYTIDSCALARLNVYSGVLTETEVQKLYGDQRADFIEGGQAVVPSVTGELAKVDYNTYSAGTYTSAQLTELDEKITYSKTGIYNVVNTIAGNALALAGKNASGQREASCNLALSNSVTYGRIVTDVTFKMNGSSAYRSLFAIGGKKSDGSSTTIKTIRYDGGKFKYDDGSGRGITSAETDGFGFYQLAFELISPDELSDWKLSVYDKTSDSGVPLCTITIARSALNEIVSARTGYIYVGSDAQEEENITVKSAKVNATAIGGLEEVGKYDSASRSIELKFNTPVDIPKGQISAVSLSGYKAYTKVSKGKTNKELLFSFPLGLPEVGEYTLNLEKIPYNNEKLYFSEEIIFEAEKTKAALYNVVIKNEEGKTIDNLDGALELNVSYDTMSDAEGRVYLVKHDKDGVVLNASTADIQAKSLSAEIAGAEFFRIYLWNENSLEPMSLPLEIGYSDDGERVVVPLTVQGAFYNDDDESINYMKGQTGIKAKARLTAGEPPENITATLKLTRDDENIYSKTEDVIFDKAGNADVSVVLENIEPKSGDILTFTIANGNFVYLTKWMSFEDLSKIVDILLIAGQSNAEGHMGNAKESIKVEKDTVYLNTMGNNTLATEGIKGWAGSLGKTWHDRTGHTVVVIRAAKGGTGFADGNWVTDGACYKNAKTMYQAAIASVQAKSGFEIGECVYFWLQGENEQSANWTAEQYEDAFMTLHKGFTEDFGTTAETKLTQCGILPVRSGNSTFPANLISTGVRAAQYKMAAENEDISIVSSATEYWNSDEGVSDWFEKTYDDKFYPSGDLPMIMYDVFMNDNVHYAQLGYNELGIEAANNMLDYIEGKNTCTGIAVMSSEGLKVYEDGADIHLSAKDSLISIYPLGTAKTVEYTLSGNIAADMTEYGVITPKKAFANIYTTLTVKTDGKKEMSLKLYSPIADDSISIASVRDNKKAIYTFITDDGYWDSTNFYQGEFERLGMSGTVALIPGQIEEGKANRGTWEEWETLLSKGNFTAANHTMNHVTNTYINNISGLTDTLLETEINDSRELIMDKLPGQRVLGLVLPGNWAASSIVKKAREQHSAIRSGSGNTALPISNEDDLYALHFQTLQDETTVDTMNGWVDTSVSKGQWVIEMWHGVRDGEDANPNSQGYSPDKKTATAHFEYISGLEDLWIASWDDGIAYNKERLRAKISMLSQTTTEMKIELKDDLDDKLFDVPLTVNIELPDGWTGAEVTQNGKVLSGKIVSGVLSVNIIPDSGAVTIRKS